MSKIKTNAVGKGFGKQGKKPEHTVPCGKGGGQHAGEKPSASRMPRHSIPTPGAVVREESKYGKARR